ncbi:MAG: 4-alpha-glucanotransferase [Atribacterota bacterium]
MQLPLYALDTPGNQGIGDLGDLKMIQEMVRKNQGGFVGILPIHLLENRLPRGISPYFPLTRMLWNPIYLSLEEVFRFHGFSGDGSDLMEWCSTIDDWKKDPWIDYEKVWDFKKNFLRKIFHHFIDHESVLPSPRWNSFQTYFREEGEDLLASSVFLFLGDLNPENENPPSLDSSVIHNIYHTYHREVLFYAYLQWLMDSFLKLLWNGGGILGFDLPVGTSPSGIECWLHRDVFTLSQRDYSALTKYYILISLRSNILGKR